MPLHTLRADIDYGMREARTSTGRVGVKVWIYKGDILPYRTSPEDKISCEAAMAVGETSGQARPRRIVSAGGGRRRPDMAEPGAVPEEVAEAEEVAEPGVEPVAVTRACARRRARTTARRRRRDRAPHPRRASRGAALPQRDGLTMLMPKKVKHRKQHRGRTTGLAKGATTVDFGDYGIKALEPGWLTARQIEAARIAMTRHVRRGGKIWIPSSRTSRSPKSLPRPAWGRARGIRSTGLRS